MMAEDLLKDVTTNGELSTWFTRVCPAGGGDAQWLTGFLLLQVDTPAEAVVKKPNSLE